MNERPIEPDGISPEWLAAYVDGELDGPARTQVEAWLVQHPEAAAEVEFQRWLARFCDQTRVPLPREDRWQPVLHSLQALQSQGGSGFTFRRTILAVFTAAAALLLAFLFWPRPERPGELLDETPFPVVSADEVRIESIHEADMRLLIVGAPPVSGPMEFLTSTEVTIRTLNPDELGRTGVVRADVGLPIIVMPPALDPANSP